MFTNAFVKDMVERAVRAFGASGASLFAAGEAVNVLELNWAELFGTAGGAAVVSVLLSLGAYKAAGMKGTASAVKNVTYVGGKNVL